MLANFSRLSVIFEKRSSFNLLFSIFLYNILFFLTFNQSSGQMWPVPVAAPASVLGLNAAGLCRPRQNSVIGCIRTPQSLFCSSILNTNCELGGAAGGCHPGSGQLQSFNNSNSELSPGAACCRVNFPPPRCWHWHHPAACTICTFSL